MAKSRYKSCYISPGAHHGCLQPIFIMKDFPSGVLGRGRRTWRDTSAGPNRGGLTPSHCNGFSGEWGWNYGPWDAIAVAIGVKPPQSGPADVSSHVPLPRPNTAEGESFIIKMGCKHPWWAPGLGISVKGLIWRNSIQSCTMSACKKIKGGILNRTNTTPKHQYQY